MAREFDLNIEKILENWQIHHALREIISNALDERYITKTQEIEIKPYENGWIIRDFGRGIEYHHFTQNESEEKLNDNHLIGKFGVGLKDALATLYRHGVDVTINSKNGCFTLIKTEKPGFEDIQTLHVSIDEPKNPEMEGTEFFLGGVDIDEIDKAKELFLEYTGEEIIESTFYGDIIRKDGETANIYFNGVKIASEKNFLFSYNITNPSAALKRALNRERSNVGRSAYTERVQKILINSKSESVSHNLIEELKKFGTGRAHDELSWSDIKVHAAKLLEESKDNVVLVTAKELEDRPDLIDEIASSGKETVVIPGDLYGRLEDINSRGEKTFSTASDFVRKQAEEFVPEVIDLAALTHSEREIFEKTEEILNLIGGKPYNIRAIEIAKTLYTGGSRSDVVGLWIPTEKRVLIHRNQLKNLSDYAGTLLHECAHAISGASDVTRDFESQLTNMIGKITDRYLEEFKKGFTSSAVSVATDEEIEAVEPQIYPINGKKDEQNEQKSYDYLSTRAYLMIYMRGDLEKGLELLERGVSVENGSSCLMLATMYCNGDKIDKNLDKALELYSLAAQKGNNQEKKEAFRNIGALFFQDDFSQKDEEKGIRYLEKGASLGDAYSEYMLGVIYSDNERSQYNISAAIHHFKMAYKKSGKKETEYFGGTEKHKNHWYAPLELANLYRKHIELDTTQEEYFIWIKRAAKRGLPGSRISLGKAYLDGIGTRINHEKALKWFRISANEKDPEGNFYMGEFYRKGIAVMQDDEQAKEYYLRASDLGFKKATKRLKELKDL